MREPTPALEKLAHGVRPTPVRGAGVARFRVHRDRREATLVVFRIVSVVMIAKRLRGLTSATLQRERQNLRFEGARG